VARLIQPKPFGFLTTWDTLKEPLSLSLQPTEAACRSTEYLQVAAKLRNDDI